MKPMIQVMPMTDLSPYKRKKVCEHLPQCGKFLLINTLTDGLTLCQKDALDYGYAIFDKLSIFPKLQIKSADWNEEKLLLVIDFIRHNDIERGTYVKLGNKLGLTPKQVKDKVRYLRNKGAF